MSLYAANQMRKSAGNFVGTPHGRIIGAAAIAGFVGAGLGLVHTVIGNEKLGLNGGEQAIVSTYAMPADTCYGGYDTYVKDAAANIDMGLFSGSERVTFSGTITNLVCSTGMADAPAIIDPASHRVTITVPADSLNTIVYETQPVSSNFHRENSFTKTALNDVVANWNVIASQLPSGPQLNAQDDLDSRLTGWARLAAFSTSTQACGIKAWPDFQAKFESSVKIDEAKYLNTAQNLILPVGSPHHDYTPEDIVVKSPATVAFKNQYTKQLQGMVDQLSNNGVTLANGAAESLDTSSQVCKQSNERIARGIK